MLKVPRKSLIFLVSSELACLENADFSAYRTPGLAETASLAFEIMPWRRKAKEFDNAANELASPFKSPPELVSLPGRTGVLDLTGYYPSGNATVIEGATHMKLQRPVSWPNGAKVACAISLDMDADSLVHIHHGDRAGDKLSAMSMLRYGPQVAIPRILETYRKFGLKQSFFIPAWCMENHAAAVDAIVRDGHEVGYHGYIHEAPNSLSPQQEMDWMCKSIEIIERHTGKRPRGNRSPLYHMSAKTPELLAELGFLYDSSLMGDDVPYYLDTPSGRLLELPVSWATDDWPPYVHAPDLGYMFPPKPPDAAMDIFLAEFEALRQSPGGVWIGVWHPFVSGRLSRWQRVERMIEFMLNTGDVWFASLEEITSHVNEETTSGRYRPRVDPLPYTTGNQVPEELVGKA